MNWETGFDIHMLLCIRKITNENSGEGNGSPLQCPCLQNPVDGRAWWAAVHRVAESRTRLKWLSMHACIGEGSGNPLQCSCLENPRDRGAWWAAVYGVAQSRTRLMRLSSSSSETLLYSTRNSIWCSWWPTCEGNPRKEGIHVYIQLIHFAV